MNYNFSFSVDFPNGIDLSQLQYEIGAQIFSATCAGGSQLEDVVIIYFDQALSTADEALLSVIIASHIPESNYDFVLTVDGTVSITSSNESIEAISVFNQSDFGGMRISSGESGCVLDSLGVMDIMANGVEITSPSVSLSANVFYNRSSTFQTTKPHATVADSDTSLSVAQITNGIISTDLSATENNTAFPTAAILIPALASVYLDILPDDSWEFSFINTNTTGWTLAPSLGNSLIGSGLVSGNSSARFRVRIIDIDVPSYSVYRLC